MQVLFVCTGCDFISFFNGLGKASFMATLFEYCNFICTNSEQVPGTLADADSSGKLSFYRLVGCAYYRKHRAVFLPSYPSPITLFNSLKKDGQSPEVHHVAWLDVIRERIWSRIKYEEEMIPSEGALYRHWLRSCWVLSVWKQADSQNIVYHPLDGNGWRQPDSETLEIDWDSNDHLSTVRTRVALLQKGCGCKTGCRTGRCKCKKSNNHCGPGCKCHGCLNLPTSTSTSQPSQSAIPNELPQQLSQSANLLLSASHLTTVDVESSDSDGSEDDGDDNEDGSSKGSISDLEMEVDQIMNDIFGDY